MRLPRAMRPQLPDLRRHAVIVALIALVSAACSAASVPSGSAAVTTSSAPTATALATNAVSASAAVATPAPTPTHGFTFRELDTPSLYSSSSAEAVDGTTAVGWVQIGIADEQPAVWDTTTGALRVLKVPAEFVHPSGLT